MKNTFLFFCCCLLVSLSGCKKNDPQHIQEPEIAAVEIGSGNERKAFIGRDFHFEAQVTAATKLSAVGISIAQKPGQSYPSVWNMELAWPEFAGAKNATVHKHFSIPTTAAAGLYTFSFIVRDENGSTRTFTADLQVLDPAALAVAPEMELKQGPAAGQVFTSAQPISIDLQVTGLQDDGHFMALLIPQSAGHHPELISQADLSRAIVLAEKKHTGLGKNTAFEVKASLATGAATDNKLPGGSAIGGSRSWQSGSYNLLLLYTNTTHGVHAYRTIPLRIQL